MSRMRKIRKSKIKRQLKVKGFKTNLFRKINKKMLAEFKKNIPPEIGRIESFRFIES